MKRSICFTATCSLDINWCYCCFNWLFARCTTYSYHPLNIIRFFQTVMKAGAFRLTWSLLKHIKNYFLILLSSTKTLYHHTCFNQVVISVWNYALIYRRWMISSFLIFWKMSIIEMFLVWVIRIKCCNALPKGIASISHASNLVFRV